MANQLLLKRTSKEYDRVREQTGKAPFLMKPLMMSAASYGGTQKERLEKEKVFESILNTILNRYPKTQAYPVNFNVKILIVGMPNVGKSTIINNLKAYGLRESGTAIKLKDSVKVGALPGVTKSISGLIKLNESPKVYIYDSPGIMIPKITNIENGFKLALTGAIKEGIIDEIALVDYLLYVLNRQENQPLKYYFKIEKPIDEIYSFLYHVSLFEKFKNLNEDEPNFLLAATHVLSLFRKGKFGAYTLDRI